jgi:hypothetical protein
MNLLLDIHVQTKFLIIGPNLEPTPWMGLRIDVLIVRIKGKTIAFPFLFPTGEGSGGY